MTTQAFGLASKAQVKNNLYSRNVNFIYLRPVVKSIVSLKMSLVEDSLRLTVLTKLIAVIVWLKKCEKLQQLLTFFFLKNKKKKNKKKQSFSVKFAFYFNVFLTNDVDSFEQPGSDVLLHFANDSALAL